MHVYTHVADTDSDVPIFSPAKRKRKTNKKLKGKTEVYKQGKKNKDDRAESSKSATKRKRSHSGPGVKKSEKKKRMVSLKNKWFGIFTRSNPRQLCLCISRLKKKQRQAVSEMGFGEMLTFNVDGIPAKLGHYVVDNFDVDEMEIKVANGEIKVDAESVHRLLGIPCNGIAVDSLTKNNKLHPAVKSWRERYPIGEYVSPTQIVKKVTEDDDDDDGFNFKLDFLMLFLATMVQCMTHGRCKDDILKYFTGDTDFSKINWCSYVVDSMKDCKELWRRCDFKSPFTGPLCILTLLYVDSIECTGMKIDRGVKPIEFWTKDRLKNREYWEIKHGGFGVGKMIGSNEGFREEIAKAGRLFEILLQNKNKFENMFGSIYEKYPTNHEVLSMKMRYESMMEDKHQWTKPVNQDIDDIGNTLTVHECNDNVVEKNHDDSDCVGERENIKDVGFHGNFMLMKQETFLTAESSEVDPVVVRYGDEEIADEVVVGLNEADIPGEMNNITTNEREGDSRAVLLAWDVVSYSVTGSTRR
ncbi:uncharacterized protein LOC143586421 [Bidens hawaiensis]|uniref:uncharacterized protein LOC143586421 n=1 Tax=Bidens hawaiensis TaxID=980011 RepID=UPI00404B9543